MEEADCLRRFWTVSEQPASLLSPPRSYGRPDGEDGEPDRECRAKERRDECASHSFLRCAAHSTTCSLR